MHETLFATAFHPRPVVCLHLPLRPFTIGHEILLAATENPLPTLSADEFDALDATAQRAALVSAVDICSQTWAEYHASADLLAAAPRWHQWRLRRRQRRLHGIWSRWRRSLSRLSPAGWALALCDFRHYLAVSRCLLPVLSPDDPRDREVYETANSGQPFTAGRSLGSPFLAQLLDFATRRGLVASLAPGGTLHDLPLAATSHLFLAWLETENRLSIENQRESQIRAELARHRAAIAAEVAAAHAAWAACTDDAGRAAAVAKHPRLVGLYPEAAALVT